MSNPVLKADKLSIQFGELKAVSDFNLEIYPGELVGLIGPNGAGKTTVFNLLTGVYKPTSGAIYLNGKNTIGKKPYQLGASGLARTFQNIRLFDSLTVLQNVMVAHDHRMTYSIFSSMFRLPKFWKEEDDVEAKSMKILEDVGLAEFADQKASNLSYGKQRLLEIARAIGTNPQVLLLDEPAAGMNPSETVELMDMIATIKNKYGLAILLIEHDMKLVLGICEKLIVLNYGQILVSGNPSEVVNNEEVIKAYLGGPGA